MEYYSRKESADILGSTERAVNNKVDRGTLDTIPIGNKRHVTRDSLKAHSHDLVRHDQITLLQRMNDALLKENSRLRSLLASTTKEIDHGE